ncbi:MAG: hypothetical protein ACR2OW_02760 [Methyloligellaceae bacterium]
MRYILLFGLGIASAIVFASASIAIVDQIYLNTDPIASKTTDIRHWVLFGLGLAGLVSLLRFVFNGGPGVVTQFMDRNRERLVTMVLGILVCAVFVMT